MAEEKKLFNKQSRLLALTRAQLYAITDLFKVRRSSAKPVTDMRKALDIEASKVKYGDLSNHKTRVGKRRELIGAFGISEPKEMIIDNSLSSFKNRNKLRSTNAHEIVHHLAGTHRSDRETHSAELNFNDYVIAHAISTYLDLGHNSPLKDFNKRIEAKIEKAISHDRFKILQSAFDAGVHPEYYKTRTLDFGLGRMSFADMGYYLGCFAHNLDCYSMYMMANEKLIKPLPGQGMILIREIAKGQSFYNTLIKISAGKFERERIVWLGRNPGMARYLFRIKTSGVNETQLNGQLKQKEKKSVRTSRQTLERFVQADKRKV